MSARESVFVCRRICEEEGNSAVSLALINSVYILIIYIDIHHHL